MTVHITLQNTQGETISQFDGEDRVSLAQMVKKAGTEIPLSCCAGMCGVCTCKVISGGEVLQIDKITSPLKGLPENEIFACIGGIKSSYIKDDILHEVVLEKDI